VLVVGAGGLGAPVVRILLEAGVGRVAVVDPDRVELENLHRQILFRDADVGRTKIEAVRARYGDRVEAIEGRLDDATGPDLVRGRACVVDGTDNFADKYRINDLCLRLDVPLVHAGAARFQGQVLTVRRGGPCLRCLLETPPAAATDECRVTGIFGPAAGVVAALAAGEALRVLAGEGRGEGGGDATRGEGSVLLADLATGRLGRARLAPLAGCACRGAA